MGQTINIKKRLERAKQFTVEDLMFANWRKHPVTEKEYEHCNYWRATVARTRIEFLWDPIKKEGHLFFNWVPFLFERGGEQVFANATYDEAVDALVCNLVDD